MSEAVIVALITGICAVVGQLVITRQQTAKRRIDEAVRDAKLDDRLSRIEERLDSHNSYAEKFVAFGTDIAVIKNDIKTLYKQQEG